jgi:hypothetical protein
MIEYELGMIKCSVSCKWPMLTPLSCSFSFMVGFYHFHDG